MLSNVQKHGSELFQSDLKCLFFFFTCKPATFNQKLNGLPLYWAGFFEKQEHLVGGGVGQTHTRPFAFSDYALNLSGGRGG